MPAVLPTSAWPTRGHICLDCRALLAGVAACPCGSEAVVQLSVQGRAILVDRVWGELDRREPVNRPAAALILVGALMFATSLLMYNALGFALGGVSVVAGALLRATRIGRDEEDRRVRRTALAAADAPLLLPAPRVFGGEVATERVCRAPMSSRYSVAYSVELRDAHAGKTFLRDAVTIGFAIESNDGRRVVVPPGPIQLAGGVSRHIVLEEQIRAYLLSCDPLWHPDHYDPIPYATAFEAVICDGDLVELHNPLVPINESAGDSGYRDAATTLLRPVGIPMIRILSRPERS